MTRSAVIEERARSEEEARVELWRWQCLVEAGVHHRAADVLAACDADLHAMEEAKRGGCGDTLLIRIFADLPPSRAKQLRDELAR